MHLFLVQIQPDNFLLQAAFLVRLVKPNIVNASIHSLLKSLSSSYASEQLAARHCFPLEDPLDDKKGLTDAEGLVYVCHFCIYTKIVFLTSM